MTNIYLNVADKKSTLITDFEDLTLVIYGLTKDLVEKTKSEIKRECQKNVLTEELLEPDCQFVCKLSNEKVQLI